MILLNLSISNGLVRSVAQVQGQSLFCCPSASLVCRPHMCIYVNAHIYSQESQSSVMSVFLLKETLLKSHVGMGAAIYFIKIHIPVQMNIK